MTKSELFQQAMGLKKSAEKALNTGRADQPAESIVRSAAQNLIWSAVGCDSNNSKIASLKTHPGMTWSEIHAIVNAIVEFAKDARPQ